MTELVESDKGSVRDMCGTKKQGTCSLVLEDGTVFTGESFGATIPVDGEVGKLVQYFVVFIFKIHQYCG